MIDPISLSMSLLPTEGDTPSNANLPKSQNGDLNLSAIPVFNSSQQDQPTSSSCSEPVSYDNGKWEYEFTCIFTDSMPMFIGLWDIDDLSACQRVSACKMDREEIVYDRETGIGFFKTVDGLRWCFKKQPDHRSIGPLNPIVATGDEEPQVKSRKVHHSAEDILASL